MKPLRIGIAGLGVVGGGTVKWLHQNAALIEERCGRKLEVVAVSARNEAKARALPLGNAKFIPDAEQLADDSAVDVIVEVIGGHDGVAKKLVEKALSKGKSVVTANKALIAHHGLALAAMAEKSGATLAFETAVAGGIPIIKSLREGLVANRISRIAGILNATCNVILTTMNEQHRDLEDVMGEAARMGLLEADPSLDIDGYDAAHKICVLSALAFGTKPDFAGVYREGIRGVRLRDMEYAGRLGYTIKLLALAGFGPEGLLARVHPCLVPADAWIGQVKGAFNAVVVDADAAGRVMFEGLGGGEGPTASAIIGDLVDIARGVKYLPFTKPVSALTEAKAFPMAQLKCSYYLRLSVSDRVGVLASVTQLLKDEGISVRTFLQEEHRPGEPAELVLTTHETGEALMQKAIGRIQLLESVTTPPQMIRMENL